jgi:cell division inhibitor SepF
MSIFQRLWDALGLGAAIDESEYDDYVGIDPVGNEINWQDEYSSAPRKSVSAANVIGMPGRGVPQTEVLLVEPRSFEEIPSVVSALKERKTVVLSLNLMDADTAQRCVDFVAGGVFAIDGHQERVGETVFLFTPSFVQIKTHFAEELDSISEATESTIPPRRPTYPVRPYPLGEELQNIRPRMNTFTEA